ncbi:DUF1054 domain-containing protein [Gorillibacterium massiliense]|uniref:DUF1054 domain-containing protein n=1 Tax=Gorillibacterium massiliense TaxID=1280390 RepID=UPI0004B040EC|nr:DUF1054 domain-containing protein [Gorillibacterium massiliense]
MKFTGFEPADFELFTIEGLEERMAALIKQLRPKFVNLGEDLLGPIRDITGTDMFAHVAKHARRKTNPPADSWIAFAANPRGYKMLPHFQIAVWPTHVLIQWGIIYEAPNKKVFADSLIAHLDEVKRSLPDTFTWSKDHMKPEGEIHSRLSDDDFADFANRLRHNKNGEIMVGLSIAKQNALAMPPHDFLATVTDVWEKLMVLHRLATDSNALIRA